MAVKLAGASLIVVATPSTVVRTGVMVATGEPLASTDTHGSRVGSVRNQQYFEQDSFTPKYRTMGDIHQLLEPPERQKTLCCVRGQ